MKAKSALALSKGAFSWVHFGSVLHTPLGATEFFILKDLKPGLNAQKSAEIKAMGAQSGHLRAIGACFNRIKPSVHARLP